MAANNFLLLLRNIFFVVFARSFQLECVVSHEYTTTTTTIYDVSASFQRTVDVLSFVPAASANAMKPIQEQQKTTISSSTSSSTSRNSFSLPLHPRSSVHKSPVDTDDYAAITLSRLERDSERVKHIWTRLKLALTNVDSVDEEEEETSTTQPGPPSGPQMPLISGLGFGSGEYFSRLGVGQPAREMYLTIDTGSDVCWIQCLPCKRCYNQTDPIFDPSGSSTYRPVPCNSSHCKGAADTFCDGDKCMYQAPYADYSYSVGDLGTETISFQDSVSANEIAIGCGHENMGLFRGAAGLLGLDGGPLSLPSQLKATSFSYCLVNRDSNASSTLEFNSVMPGDSITAPLTRNPIAGMFFYVGVTGIMVGGKRLAIPPPMFELDASGGGGVIVDTGTVVTRLPTQVYDWVRRAFIDMSPSLPPPTRYRLFDTCYDLSSFKNATIATVSFLFAGDKILTLPADNYMVHVNSVGLVCLGFAPSDAGTMSIIGNIMQQGIRVTFDLANSVIGFSQAKC